MAAGAVIKLCAVTSPVSGSDINERNDLGLGIAGTLSTPSPSPLGLGTNSVSSDGSGVSPAVIGGDKMGDVLGFGLTLGEMVVPALGVIVVPIEGVVAELGFGVVTVVGFGVDVDVGHALYGSLQVPNVCPKYD